MRVSMLVASEDATSGSDIAKQDLIRPATSGSSHRCFCSAVPYIASTPMLPVSGAEQLKTSGANAGDRPMISQSGAYSTLVRPPPGSLAGRNKFHKPDARAFVLSSSTILVGCQRSPSDS